jgi:alpha-L-fucosidase
VEAAQAVNYSYNAQRIIKMLQTCASGGGNLLLNIGPAPDGSVPEDAVEPLTTVGKWLEQNSKAVYGKLIKNSNENKAWFGSNGITSASSDGKIVYLWTWIWPTSGEMGIGGYMNAPKSVHLLKDGTPIEFEHKGHRILLKNMQKKSPDETAGVTVIAMDFDEKPEYMHASYYPQLHGGRDVAGDNKI